MMKTSIPALFVALILFCHTNVHAQKIKPTEVPVAVLRTVNTEYPSVKNIDWERTKDNLFIAAFYVNATETSLVLNASGTILTNTKADKESIAGSNFSYADIPLNVRKQIETKYNPAEILCVNKLKKDGKVDVYEINFSSKKIFFDANGFVLEEFSK